MFPLELKRATQQHAPPMHAARLLQQLQCLCFFRTCVPLYVLQAARGVVGVAGEPLLHRVHVAHERGKVADHGRLLELGHCVDALVACNTHNMTNVTVHALVCMSMVIR